MAFVKSSETDLFITASGRTYVLSNPPARFVMSEEGTGMPPIDYVTQRGPYQHGESLRDYFLTPRTVQYIVRHNYCSREDYWAGRGELISVLAPNNGPLATLATGTLRKVMPGGTVRDLTCIIDQGPKFEPRDPSQWDELSYTETLRFIAHNPIYFDPNAHSLLFHTTDAGTFPITFPITFLPEYNIEETIVYAGTWFEYPIITVVGPMTSFTITNVTTGASITVEGLIDTGRTLTIDLTYGRKTVTLDDGTNFIGYVTADSNLAQFAIIPGTNDLFVTAFLIGPFEPRDRVTMTYYDRYFGI